MNVGPIVPELPYEDTRAAAAWLVRAFGFAEKLRIGAHRIQMRVGSDGGFVVIERRPEHGVCRTMVPVSDAHAHCARAREAGAVIVNEPTDWPYGERQYTARDVGGHLWTFSQTIADVAPEDWGGETIVPWGHRP